VVDNARVVEREEGEGEGKVDMLSWIEEVEEQHYLSKLEVAEALVRLHHPCTPLLPFPSNPLPSLRFPN